MITTRPPNLLAAALAGALAFGADCTTAQAQTITGAELNRRTVERRAVDAVIWGLPLGAKTR